MKFIICNIYNKQLPAHTSTDEFSCLSRTLRDKALVEQIKFEDYYKEIRK